MPAIQPSGFYPKFSDEAKKQLNSSVTPWLGRNIAHLSTSQIKKKQEELLHKIHNLGTINRYDNPFNKEMEKDDDDDFFIPPDSLLKMAVSSLRRCPEFKDATLDDLRSRVRSLAGTFLNDYNKLETLKKKLLGFSYVESRVSPLGTIENDFGDLKNLVREGVESESTLKADEIVGEHLNQLTVGQEQEEKKLMLLVDVFATYMKDKTVDGRQINQDFFQSLKEQVASCQRKHMALEERKKELLGVYYAPSAATLEFNTRLKNFIIVIDYKIDPSSASAPEARRILNAFKAPDFKDSLYFGKQVLGPDASTYVRESGHKKTS